MFFVISFSDCGTFPTCIYFTFELSSFHRLKACQNRKKKVKIQQSRNKTKQITKIWQGIIQCIGVTFHNFTHVDWQSVYVCLLHLMVQVNSIFLSWLHKHIVVYKLDRHKLNSWSILQIITCYIKDLHKMCFSII